MTAITRRRLLSSAAVGAAAIGLTPKVKGEQGGYRVEDQLPFNGQTRRLKLTNRGRFLTALIFSTDYPTHFRLKPELYPVCTPAGVPVTDSHQYCFIHHQSIMTGHGSVKLAGSDRVVDFYRQLPGPDEDRDDPFHTGKNLFHEGPSGIQKIVNAEWDVADRIRIELSLEWQSREHRSEGDQALVIERRIYEVSQSGNYTVIDQFSRLEPVAEPFTLMPDRHSFVGVRVHDLIDPDDGGLMRDSEGRVNPDGNYWDPAGDRKAPRWIDCTGRIGGNTAGVALISHPNNQRNEFYCRSWGLMICSATLGHEVEVRGDRPFLYAARYVAHDHELLPSAADQLYDQFAARDYPM